MASSLRLISGIHISLSVKTIDFLSTSRLFRFLRSMEGWIASCARVTATPTPAVQRQIALRVGVLLVLGLLMARPSEASSFVFYSGGCTGNTATLNACGCSSIPSNAKGGYTFTYQGQTAAAYNSDSCTGVAQTRFTGSTGQCTGIGWQSVFIQC